MDWVSSISMMFAGCSITWEEVAEKMQTTPNSEIASTMINRGQSKYFIRLLSNRLSLMYLKNARILESMFFPCHRCCFVGASPKSLPLWGRCRTQ